MKKIAYITILFLSTATSAWAGGKPQQDDVCMELIKCNYRAAHKAVDVLIMCGVKEIEDDFKRSLPDLIRTARTKPIPCRQESWNPRMAKEDLELCNKFVQIQENIRQTCLDLMEEVMKRGIK